MIPYFSKGLLPGDWWRCLTAKEGDVLCMSCKRNSAPSNPWWQPYQPGLMSEDQEHCDSHYPASAQQMLDQWTINSVKDKQCQASS